VALFLSLVLIMFVAGAGIAHLATRADDRDPTEARQRTDELEVQAVGFGSGLTLREQPGDRWLFDPADVLPGSTVGWEPLFLDDVIVATLTTEDYEDRAVVGLGAETGNVLWSKTDDEIGEWCSVVDEGNGLVCARADDSGLDLVDPETGDAGIGYTIDDPWWANSIGSTLYVGSRLRGRYDYDTRLTALDLSTFDEQWTVDLNPGGGSEDYGSTEVQSARGELYLQTGPSGWRLSPPSGQILSSFGMDLEETLAEGYIIEYGPAVESWDRSVAIEGQGSIWSGATSDVIDGRIGIGDTLYDVATGQVIWSAPDLAGYDLDSVSWSWAPGNDYIFANDPYDDYGDSAGTTLIDAATGEDLWHTEDSLSYYDSVLTDDAVASVTGEYTNALAVRDLDDGDTAWSASLEDLNPDFDEYVTMTPGITDRALIVTSEYGVMGFIDFPTGSNTSDESEGSDEGDDDTAYTTACGTPPEFVPVESAAANGGITITYEVHATCPGGQWLNYSQLWVPLVVDGDGVSADSGYVYADGYFDFSFDPYWIPDAGQTLQLVYPYNQTTVPVDDISAAIDDDAGTGSIVFVPCEPGPTNVEGAVPPGPDYSADPDEPNISDGSPEVANTQEERDETALEALQRIAAEDASAVEGLEWTAQLSSKQPGTYDDGMVYDSYDDILALHLQLRAQYPDSLLLYSSDWSGTYGPTSRDYWVTLSGESEYATQPVLDWCRSTGRGEGDCWAVRPRRGGNPARNVDHAPADERNN